MSGYRYVLNLVEGGSVQVVRHVSSEPLRRGDLVAVAGHGTWRISEIVQTGDGTIGDGIASAHRADDSEGEQAAASQTLLRSSPTACLA